MEVTSLHALYGANDFFPTETKRGSTPKRRTCNCKSVHGGKGRLKRVKVVGWFLLLGHTHSYTP